MNLSTHRLSTGMPPCPHCSSGFPRYSVGAYGSDHRIGNCESCGASWVVEYLLFSNDWRVSDLKVPEQIQQEQTERPGAIDLARADGVRPKTHGDIVNNGAYAQDMKDVVRESVNWPQMPGYARECIEMILHKIARACAGDWTHDDHWADIQGYAQLIRDRIPCNK